jgi:peptide/nickel transport system permease protein
MTARHGRYIHYLASRLAFAALTLLGLMTLVFVMVKVIPGDEAQVIAGPDASPEQVAAVRSRLGLDAPLPLQYASFILRMLQGDLGTSLSTFQPVSSDLGQVLPSTLELVAVTMLMSLLTSIPAATVAAAWRGGALDGTTRVLAVIGGGLPAFWLALIGQYLFGSRWGVLPISGQLSFEYMVPSVTGMPTVDALLAGDLPAFADAVAHIVLPAGALAVFFAAQLFRTLRASLLGILESDFIAPVRAKGASFSRIVVRHALPNALGPTVTLAGTQLGLMIGSAVLVEGIFTRQGVGAYLANGVLQKDTFAVLGCVFFVGAVVCLVNLIVDVLQLVIDPRVRAVQLEGGSR